MKERSILISPAHLPSPERTVRTYLIIKSELSSPAAFGADPDGPLTVIKITRQIVEICTHAVALDVLTRRTIQRTVPPGAIAATWFLCSAVVVTDQIGIGNSLAIVVTGAETRPAITVNATTSPFHLSLLAEALRQLAVRAPTPAGPTAIVGRTVGKNFFSHLATKADCTRLIHRDYRKEGEVHRNSNFSERSTQK